MLTPSEPELRTIESLCPGATTANLPGAPPGARWVVARIVEQGSLRAVLWWSPDRPHSRHGYPYDLALTMTGAVDVLVDGRYHLPVLSTIPGLTEWCVEVRRLLRERVRMLPWTPGSAPCP